ncbi:MAG TPA: hypothetical protein VFZ78_01205, partial [Flavisolibacter sp.]
AVRQAKLDYLADPKINPRMKHPYFWSHIVFVGNYSRAESLKLWPFLVAAAVLLLLFIAAKSAPRIRRRFTRLRRRKRSY